MRYRKEVDGLRALAIIPVILYHAGYTLFSGGYVGVDVFFVISGYLITSIILYVPANILPIMHTTFLGKTSESTILGGVVTLWEHGSYPIALVIFVASVLIPISKIFVFIWLCISVHFGSTMALSQKTRLYRITEFVGAVAMLLEGCTGAPQYRVACKRAQ